MTKLIKKYPTSSGIANRLIEFGIGAVVLLACALIITIIIKFFMLILILLALILIRWIGYGILNPESREQYEERMGLK